MTKPTDKHSQNRSLAQRADTTHKNPRRPHITRDTPKPKKVGTPVGGASPGIVGAKTSVSDDVKKAHINRIVVAPRVKDRATKIVIIA